jgi:hypothetical protein
VIDKLGELLADQGNLLALFELIVIGVQQYMLGQERSERLSILEQRAEDDREKTAELRGLNSALTTLVGAVQNLAGMIVAGGGRTRR